MNISELFDLAKAREGIKADRLLAQRIGCHPNTLRAWRDEISYPTDDAMVQLSRLAGLPVAHGLMLLNIWRTDGPTSSIYRVMAESLGLKIDRDTTSSGAIAA